MRTSTSPDVSPPTAPEKASHTGLRKGAELWDAYWAEDLDRILQTMDDTDEGWATFENNSDESIPYGSNFKENDSSWKLPA